MKFFLNILITSIIVTAFLITVALYIYNNVSIFELTRLEHDEFGATITEVTGTTLISDLDTILTANFNALNNGKIENSSTTINAITTLSNLTTAGSLVTVGALSSGSLTTGFTVVPVALGGTGTTSPSIYQVILGNGASGLTIASSTGTSGQVFTSNGAGVYPNWQTYAVDEAGAYIWIGGHLWTGAASSSKFSVLNNLSIGKVATTTIKGETVATSTFAGNIQVLGNASTTDLVISGNQTGGTWMYTGSSTAATGCEDSNCDFTGCIPSTANFAIIQVALDGNANQGTVTLARSGITSVSYGGVAAGTSDGDGLYTIAWSGDDINIEEVSDVDTNDSLSFTAYWYK